MNSFFKFTEGKGRKLFEIYQKSLSFFSKKILLLTFCNGRRAFRCKKKANCRKLQLRQYNI